MNWPFFDEDQINRVVAVLRSGRINYWNGDQARAFERVFAEHMECRYGVALSNGTVALEAALHAIELAPGDEVVVSPRSFYASAGCVVIQGGIPVFADVDRHSQNLTAASIEAVLTPKTKAIICVHLAGWPCDMDPIMALAERYNLWVIEDCAQAHGATYKKRPVGSIGHLAGFSFCTDKIMSTGGEGGMLTTQDEQLWRRVWEYKDHGRSWDAYHRADHPPGFRWYIESFGTNWRMTEMQAAIGHAQLDLLPEWLARRRAHAAILDEMLQDLPCVRLPRPKAHEVHAYYKYYFFVRPDHLKAGWSRDRIMQAINAVGVSCLVGVCPEIYREQAFVSAGYEPPQPLNHAHELSQTSLMLEVHPTLDEAEMTRRGRLVQAVLREACR